MKDIIERLRQMQDEGKGYLNVTGLAKFTGESRDKYDKARWTGRGGPVFTKIGNSVRYSIDDVIEWLEGLPRFVSTSETVEDAQRKRSVEERDADRKQEVNA